jgi:riboflavin synthase
MFTGIVSAVGTVVASGRNRLAIDHAQTARRLNVGASVAVNGCCLTVVEKSGVTFRMDVVPETLKRTNIGLLKRGEKVNLELPVAATGLLDGHIVQGHVDATGKVKRVAHVRAGRELDIQLPATIRRYVAEKGSIAVDGISVTVVRVERMSFRVALIPHTLNATIADQYVAGTVVNLEADLLARYVARNLRR